VICPDKGSDQFLQGPRRPGVGGGADGGHSSPGQTGGEGCLYLKQTIRAAEPGTKHGKPKD